MSKQFLTNKNKHVSQPYNDAQQPNDGGGYAYKVSDLELVKRFCLIGTEGGTYYVSQTNLTKRSLNAVERAIQNDYKSVLNIVVEYADKAPKKDYVLYLYALLLSKDVSRVLTASKMQQVCKIPTHLFMVLEYYKQIRGEFITNRTIRNAISKWLLENKNLSYHMAKYFNREGWDFGDVLRIAHTKPKTELQNKLFAYAVNKSKGNTFEVTQDMGHVYHKEYIIDDTDVYFVSEYIKAHNLTHEMINNNIKDQPAIWSSLLFNMPLTAMMRNLGKMTSVGILNGVSNETKHVVSCLTDVERIKKANIHPLNVLLALSTYKSGSGFRGNLRWTPNKKVVSALEEMLKLSFNYVSPTNKNFYIGVDVSGSMSQTLQNTNITAAQFASVLAVTINRSEPWCIVKGFSSGLYELNADSYRDSLDQRGYTGTNVSVAVQDAIDNMYDVDAFIIITDNDVNEGYHLEETIKRYERKIGHKVKVIVLSVQANDSTIANPNNPNMMDVCGFDASIPSLVSEFMQI